MKDVPVETVQREVSLEVRAVKLEWSRWRRAVARPQSVELEGVVLRVREGVRRSGGEQ